MANSGQITLTVESIDYKSTSGLPEGTCYNDGNAWAFGRGATHWTSVLNWTVDANNRFNLTYVDGQGVPSWFVCSVRFSFEVQWSPDGVSDWQTLAYSEDTEHDDCNQSSTRILVKTLEKDLVGAIGSIQLTRSGYIRVYTTANNACPDSTFPNSYPVRHASQATAVPVYVEVDYRPGKIWNGSSWKSHNRSGGAANVRTSSSWKEMKTTDGGTGTGNPPSIYNNGWKNQRKIGSE